MTQIAIDISRPVVFIRFNPDSYTDSNKKIPSCFKVLKNSGILVVRCENAWNSRLNKLKEIITENLHEIPEIPMTIVHLFYDN